VICRSDTQKLQYLLRFLAYLIQHPDRNPETAIVLKSAHQGTGKTTLNYCISKILGGHAITISDKSRLFDGFNASLETVVFVDADELLWAGDHGASDALKSLITGDTIILEIKHGARWSVPNRLHTVMTTDHEHAVQAGVQDRRFFVLEVSAHRAQDESWFSPLYADLNNGGFEEVLWVLQRINVARWHPRQLPKTSESVEQQRFSADTISQWSQACIDADTIVGHPVLGNQPLGQLYASNVLYEAYKNYCKHHPASNVVFGKALTQMFGFPTRQNVGGSGTARPRTYRVPDAETWQQELDRRLGIGAGP
jgi:phage/plasmid-associated DNA primase